MYEKIGQEINSYLEISIIIQRTKYTYNRFK